MIRSLAVVGFASANQSLVDIAPAHQAIRLLQLMKKMFYCFQLYYHNQLFNGVCNIMLNISVLYQRNDNCWQLGHYYRRSLGDWFLIPVLIKFSASLLLSIYLINYFSVINAHRSHPSLDQALEMCQFFILLNQVFALQANIFLIYII